MATETNGTTSLASNDRSEPTYMLLRDAKESARLNTQHEAYTNLLGFFIHPSIPNTSPTLKIADIATGTGIWLLSVAKTLPSTCTFSGFDLSNSQFPPVNSIPDNVQFFSQNILDPFPLCHRGAYDIVAVRLLSIVLVGEEWESAVKNLITLLKPGGYLQWVDGDFSSSGMSCVSSASPSYLKQGLAAYHNWIQKSNKPCDDPRRLISIFQKDERLEAVEGMMMTSERTIRTKLDFTKASIPAFKLGLVRMGMGEAEADEFEREMFMEAEGGGNYSKINMYVAVGRKRGV